jgi:hypothetical protein
MTRIAPLLKLIDERNPAAAPFCHALVKWSARVDDVADEPLAVKPAELSWAGYQLTVMAAADKWAQGRLQFILGQMMLSHVYWAASLEMEQDAVYHVFKDKIVDILLFAVSEVVTVEELVQILLKYQYGTFKKD